MLYEKKKKKKNLWNVRKKIDNNKKNGHWSARLHDYKCGAGTNFCSFQI